MPATRLFQVNIFQGGGVDPDASKLTAIMDGLDDRLATVVGNNHYAYPVESITVPCSVVGYPSRIDYDMAMDRGGDTFTLPIWFVVGKSNTADARDRLSAVLANSPGIKDAVDGAYAWGDVRITTGAIEELTVNAVAYLAARFDCEVYA